MPLTAHVAELGIKMDWIAFVIPFSALIKLAIVQDHTTGFGPDIDRAGNFAIKCLFFL
jgi:hypothetical protein